MNHLISQASTNPPSESPSKKLKLENNISLKQELSSTSSTPTPQLHSPAANNMINFNMMANNSTSLWGSFPMYNQNSYQPVYPGMVPQYLTHNVSELHNVMKIGECSIKPLGQWRRPTQLELDYSQILQNVFTPSWSAQTIISKSDPILSGDILYPFSQICNSYFDFHGINYLQSTH